MWRKICFEKENVHGKKKNAKLNKNKREKNKLFNIKYLYSKSKLKYEERRNFGIFYGLQKSKNMI